MAATARAPPPVHALVPRRHRATTIRAFRREDFDGFAKRVTSGEALRDAWRGANEGVEQIAFEARRAAERIERRFQISRRLDSVARSAGARAREIDNELGVGRRVKSFSVDFYRNWPRYRKELNGFVETPLGKGFTTIFFMWFVLSGWMFRSFVIATWVLPLAAPLLIGAFANNFVIEGTCPACKRRFVGYRNQVIQCAGCRNIVWQPGKDFSGGRGSRSSREASDSDIIDIEIEEK